MLSKETEIKVIDLLFKISNGLKSIETTKQQFTANLQIDPSQIFFRIDYNQQQCITPEDLQSFLNQNGTHCTLKDAKNLIYFHDKDFDGQLNYPEFLNLLFSDASHGIKKIAKKKFNPEAPQYDLPIDIEREVANSFTKELEYNQDLIELISDIKAQHDFSIQELYYSMKSYSFITSESIKAFFDRNDVSYDEEDIRFLMTRINIKKDGKICFNEFKGLFDLTFGKDDEEVMKSMSLSMSMNKSLSMSMSNNNQLTHNNNNRQGRQYECLHLSRSRSQSKSRSRSGSPNSQEGYIDYSRDERGGRIQDAYGIENKNKGYNHTISNDNEYNSEVNDYDSNNNNNNHSFYTSQKQQRSGIKQDEPYNYTYNYNYCNYDKENANDRMNKFDYYSSGLDTSNGNGLNNSRMNQNLVLRKSPQRKILSQKLYD